MSDDAAYDTIREAMARVEAAPYRPHDFENPRVPIVRIAPPARVELERRINPNPPTVTPLSTLFDNELRTMHGALLEADARAWLAGHRLGPLRFSYEQQDANAWTVRCTADVIPVDADE